MSEETTATAKEVKDLSRVQFFSGQRFFWTIWTAFGLCVVTVGHPLTIITALPLATVFWDWWHFSFRKNKQSETIPSWYLGWKDITAEEIDKYVKYTVNSRRTAFIAAIFLSTLSIMFWRDGILIAFWGTYYAGSIGAIGFALLFKIIKFPYPNVLGGESSNSPLFDSGSFDAFSTTNSMGYYNPSSSNYRFD